MKKFYRFLLLLSSAGFLLTACTTRASTVTETPVSVIQPAQPELPPIEEVLEFMEQLRIRIRQNGKDLRKYFYFDDDNRIVVKADFTDETGDYEVIYDLLNMQTLDDHVYEVGFLINDRLSGESIEDTLIWRPDPGSEGILLAMDDNYMERWEDYFDLFDQYESKVTFFIQGAFNQLTTGPFCMAALERGHDIGFHSINHFDLRRVTRKVFMEETIAPLHAYRKEGIYVTAFAYPFGFSEPWMHEILFDSYSVLRGYGVTYRIYSDDEIRSSYIISRAIDNTVIRTDDNYESIILSMLRTIKFLDDGRVVPLTTHDISETAAWGISEARLEFLLKTAVELNLKFYRYCDFQKEGILEE